MGRHEEAEQMFYMARELKEYCPLCYYNIGNSLFSRQLYDRAIWCWQQSQKLDASHPQIEYRIAQAFWAKGDRKQAKAHFLAELCRSPGDIDVLLDTGILLLEIDELDQAREKFHRILELQPSHSQAYHYLGELCMYNGRIAQAVESFFKALQCDPNQHGSHYRLAQCYLKLGQTANARKHLIAEYKLMPEQHEILLDLGCLLAKVGALDEAMFCLERVIESHPDDWRAVHNLSLCCYDKEQFDDGIKLSQKVLQREPNHIPALHNLAYAYLKKGDLQEAKRYAQLACDLSPDDQELKKLKRDITIRHHYNRISSTCGKLLRQVKKQIGRK